VQPHFTLTREKVAASLKFPVYGGIRVGLGAELAKIDTETIQTKVAAGIIHS
jgi:hypothetical protein